MNIGFVSTWFERGAAYVTKAFINALKDNNNIFIYARGGEKYATNDPNWDLPNVTWGPKLYGTNIDYNHIKKWIVANQIDTILFNEQREMLPVLKIKRDFPEIRVGSYIDYYTLETVDDFKCFDFLICNTKRHYSVFKDHHQCYYVPWGTDINLFNPRNSVKNDKLTFFHSAGMSTRKGTDILLQTFIKCKIFQKAQLILHTQISISNFTDLSIEELSKFNIKVIEKTVTAPGLYHLGDVYVYPTTLDGLGLTIFEALASGLPVITTDNGPMNEVISDKNGRLVSVKQYVTRSDGYYWPLSYVEENSLKEALEFYCNHFNEINDYKQAARLYAEENLSWNDRKELLNRIFCEITTNSYINKNQIKNNMNKIKLKNKKQFYKQLIQILPAKLQYYMVKTLKI